MVCLGFGGVEDTMTLLMITLMLLMCWLCFLEFKGHGVVRYFLLNLILGIIICCT